MTPLDQAHTEMEANSKNEALRMAFFERLIDSQIFLLLEEEPEGDKITPMVFPLEDHSVVLAFDTEERLTSFTEKITPYAALSGRAVVAVLEGQALGLGVNLGVAPSSILIPPLAVDWLRSLTGAMAEKTTEKPQEFLSPGDMGEEVVLALTNKMKQVAGLAKEAFLLMVHYEGGRKGNLLAVIDVEPVAQAALAQAVAEAMSFSGTDVEIDVGFFQSSDPVCLDLKEHGVNIAVPELKETEEVIISVAPGSDPEKPPILR